MENLILVLFGLTVVVLVGVALVRMVQRFRDRSAIEETEERDPARDRQTALTWLGCGVILIGGLVLLYMII